MNLHVLGVCGTFMGGLAQLAQQLGHRVTGSDKDVYPPMSEELARAGIEAAAGYDPARIPADTELLIVGNALSRGNAAVERALAEKTPYISGPQWLAENVLAGRRVLAVAGTHGKTTTAAMLAWMLQDAGLEPGFLIGGVPENFGRSAALGASNLFVVEADEYDTAFFDKRSKFIHYRPDVLIINNIEYDHADIFPDTAAIITQFHHLVRTVPANGRIIARAQDPNVDALLELGCWSPVTRFGAGGDWHTEPQNLDYSAFQVFEGTRRAAQATSPLPGEHNADNALAALIAAAQAGVPPAAAADLSRFKGVKRRLQLLATVRGIAVYDDFAHHPTAIAHSLRAMKNRIGEQRLIAVLELRSNTMKAGTHRKTLAAALAAADRVHVLDSPGLDWDLRGALAGLGAALRLGADVEDVITQLDKEGKQGDHIVIMSNGGFENIHQRLAARLAA